MELKELLQILRRWYWLLALGTIAGIIAGFLVLRSFTPWPRYQATATIMVDSPGGTNEAGQALRETYAALAVRRPITQAVVDAVALDMTADDLPDLIQAEVIGRTSLIEISATHGDRRLAAAIANEVVNQLEQVTLSGEQQTIQRIAAAESPLQPQLGGYIALLVAGVTGLTAAGGLILISEYLRDRLHTAQDVQERLGLPVLATIHLAGGRPTGLRAIWPGKNGPEERANNPSASANNGAKLSFSVEKYQWLCFGIDHAYGGPPKKLLVAGPAALEEQLSMVVGMASTWAENQRRVVLVNACSKPPVISAWFGFTEHGRSNAKAKIQSPAEPVNDADVVPAGEESDEQALAVVMEETPFIETTPQNDILDKLALEADMVVVNGPAILASPQAAVMASYVDAILFVLVAGQTGTREAREALRVLDLAGGKIMGVTLLTL